MDGKKEALLVVSQVALKPTGCLVLEPSVPDVVQSWFNVSNIIILNEFPALF